MNDEQIKVITEGLVEASKLGTVNALTYIQKGLEAYKMVEIPNCYGGRKPYEESKEVRMFIDFMLIYLDEAIKTLERARTKKDD